MHIAYPEQAWGFVAVAAVIGLAVWALLRKFRGWRAFQTAGSDARLFASPVRSWALLRVVLRCVAVVLVGVAILGPCWGEYVQPAPPVRGRDVFLLLDVSRSMMAEDVAPNRLEGAKAVLRYLAGLLEQQGGYRVSLLAFADRAIVLCPLTTDYHHFYQELRDANLESVRARQAGQVWGTGTQIQQALARASDLLVTQRRPTDGDADPAPYCDIVLVSDGGDELDPDAKSMAQDLAHRRVCVHTLGVGDPTKDAPIPVTLASGARHYLHHEGRQVGTRLQEMPLQQVAEITRGMYLHAGAGPQAVDRLFQELQAKASRQLTKVGEVRDPIHRYQWFLLPAVLLLLLENVLPGPLRRRTESSADGIPRRASWLVRLVPPRPERRPALPKAPYEPPVGSRSP
jgi:Ca-activated chloride channel family protein